MTTLKRILIICRSCKGSKTQEIYENGILIDTIDCPVCEALGKMSLEWVETCEDNVFESHIILEELDVTEYNALTDAQKAGINMLLCCGFVDLNVGKAGRVRLVNWFGAGSTTVANLTALLT